MAQSEPVAPVDEDAPVVRDDAYYAEVLEAVGRGAPTLLLGTSTRSLARSVEKLQEAQRGSAKATAQRNAKDAAADIMQLLKTSRREILLGAFLFYAALAGIVLLVFYASAIPWWGIALSAIGILTSGVPGAVILYDNVWEPIKAEWNEVRFHKTRVRDPKKRASNQPDGSQKRS